MNLALVLTHNVPFSSVRAWRARGLDQIVSCIGGFSVGWNTPQSVIIAWNDQRQSLVRLDGRPLSPVESEIRPLVAM